MDITLLSTDSDTWAFGLRSISAVLRAAGHNPRLVFMGTNEQMLSKRDLDDLVSLTRETDLLGISCLARTSEKAKQVIEYLRPRKKMVVWGGVHASLNPAECAEWADIVCRGEGEGMMLDLVECLEAGNDWRRIENIAYRDNGRLELNSIRPPIPNLDELPFPDFFFENEFHLKQNGICRVSSDEKDGARLMFNGSRGCAFQCTYCCNTRLKRLYPSGNHYVRRMSIGKLIQHAMKLREILPHGNCIYFLDEDFLARPVAELAEFAAEYPREVALPFECMTYPARVTHERMDLLVRAGLYRINMGIESGSERTRREVYDRHVSNGVVKQAAQIISSYSQVVPKYFFIIANPFEEREDLLETARLIPSLPVGSYIQTYNLVFFPGSDLYKKAIEGGLIRGKHESGYELDYLSGLNYATHAWKKRNLYLNGLIYLMQGTSTRLRVGSLPRFLISSLLNPRYIEVNEKYPLLIRLSIGVQLYLFKLMHFAGRILQRITGDSTAKFNFAFFLRKKSLENVARYSPGLPPD